MKQTTSKILRQNNQLTKKKKKIFKEKEKRLHTIPKGEEKTLDKVPLHYSLAVSHVTDHRVSKIFALFKLHIQFRIDYRFQISGKLQMIFLFHLILYAPSCLPIELLTSILANINNIIILVCANYPICV